LANLSITGHLRCFSDQPVAEIVQCGEPIPFSELAASVDSGWRTGGARTIYTADEKREAAETARHSKTMMTEAVKKVELADRAIMNERQAIAIDQTAKDVEFKKKFATFKDKVFEFFSKTFGPAVAKTDAAMAALFPDTDRFITERRYRCATKRPGRLA
jgi:hypothetical protein